MTCCCDDKEPVLNDCSCLGCEDNDRFGAHAAPCCFLVRFTGSATLPVSSFPDCVGECEDLNGDHYLSSEFGGTCEWTGPLCRQQPYEVCGASRLVLTIGSESPYKIRVELQPGRNIWTPYAAAWEVESDEPFACTEFAEPGLELTLVESSSDGSCVYPATCRLISAGVSHANCYELDYQCSKCYEDSGGDDPAYRNLTLTLAGVASLDPVLSCDECENLNGISIPLRRTSSNPQSCVWSLDEDVDYRVQEDLVRPSITICAENSAACMGEDAMCLNSVTFSLTSIGGDVYAIIAFARVRPRRDLPQFTESQVYAIFKNLVCSNCLQRINFDFGAAYNDCVGSSFTFTNPWDVQVLGTNNKCDWSGVTATIALTTRASACAERTLPCKICYDYQPSDLVVTIPSGHLTGVNECLEAGATTCDIIEGTFQVAFARETAEGCVWEYSFDNADIGDGTCPDILNPAPDPFSSVEGCCPRTVTVTIDKPFFIPDGKVRLKIQVSWQLGGITWETQLDAESNPGRDDRHFVFCDSILEDALSVPFESEGRTLYGCFWDGTAATIQRAS